MILHVEISMLVHIQNMISLSLAAFLGRYFLVNQRNLSFQTTQSIYSWRNPSPYFQTISFVLVIWFWGHIVWLRQSLHYLSTFWLDHMGLIYHIFDVIRRPVGLMHIRLDHIGNYLSGWWLFKYIGMVSCLNGRIVQRKRQGYLIHK